MPPASARNQGPRSGSTVSGTTRRPGTTGSCPWSSTPWWRRRSTGAGSRSTSTAPCSAAANRRFCCRRRPGAARPASAWRWPPPASTGTPTRWSCSRARSSGRWASRPAPASRSRPAWPLIEPFVPELRARRVHRRADGKTVRYPPPPCDPRDPTLARSWPVRWIVFPRYVARGGTRLVRLDRVEALCRLLAETPAMRVDLDPPFVRRLVDWIVGVDCYALEFDGFEPATAALLAMVGAPGPGARPAPARELAHGQDQGPR
jgi:hypothetical protein